jgi:ketosteroid isomerase-like protein
MWLCDTPNPEYGVADDAERIELILALYTEDAVWEGVGEYYTGQFGRAEGKPAIRRHFQGFWGEKQDPALVLNAHYLTSEQIHVEGETATGQWIHVQPWLFSDGRALLRSSRLNNAFRRDDGVWRITRTRTENVFVAPLAPHFASDFPSTSVLTRP